MPGPRRQYAIELTEPQVAALTHLSVSYTAPFAHVQRARLLLLAHHHPDWTNHRIAQTVGCCVDTVRVWRQRWQQEPTFTDRPRVGAPQTFPSLVRAQIVALACTKPAHYGKVWQRWNGERLARVAVEQGLVATISPSTIRRWLREDAIKPWQYHSWQHSTDARFVEKAGPVLDLYEQAHTLAQQGEAVWGVDEKTSIQARQRVSATKAAAPGYPVRVADRYRRMGAVTLFCALMVATGVTFAQCFFKRTFADFKAFLLALFRSALCQGLKVLHLILDNGSTHAPKQLANWIVSLNLTFEVRIYWLPTHASWLDQVEIIFSKVQRDVLTPNDFTSVSALVHELMVYFAELNQQPKPIQWTYTKAKLIAKFGTPPPAQHAA